MRQIGKDKRFYKEMPKTANVGMDVKKDGRKRCIYGYTSEVEVRRGPSD